jgi:dipeptidyl-peptidase-4
LSDIYRFYKFYPAGIENLRSMNDGEHYTVLEQYRRIEKYDYKDGKKISTVLDINKPALNDIKYIEEYEFSQDETKILITANKEKLYRHSFVADFYIYDLKKAEIQPLSKNGQQQLATFSPDGSKIAFVRDNNLFINDLATGIEKQITFDGEKNKIINGIPDWVYEEEFAFNKAYAWSPDSRKLAFYRFDESRVKLFKLTTYDKL